MNQAEWIPQWPENPPAEIRYHATSSVFNGLLPALPAYSNITSVEVTKVDGVLDIVIYEMPSEGNQGRLIVDFNDNSHSGTCWYTARITVEYVEYGTPVPNVTHMSYDDAQSILYNSELTVGTISTAYDRSFPEGDILSQSPAAGQIVLAGTAVNLIIAGGEGFGEDPYRIWTPQQLNSIGEHPEDWGAYFILMADIDMSAYTGTQYNIIGNEDIKFTGIFDGNGHTISDLTYDTDTAVDYVGLFGFTDNATIKNLGVEDVNIYTQGSYAGGLVGRQNGGAIINCYTTGSVTAANYSYSYAGGIVGMMEDEGTMIGSSSNCQVTASTYYYQCYAGGLIGRKDGSNLSRCYSTGTAAASSDLEQAFAGGIAGAAEYGNIVACYSTASATASSEYYEAYAGGLTGWFAYGELYNCYSMGAVTSNANNFSCTGGLIGGAESADVTKCYSTGVVLANGSGENIMGGLLGAGGNAFDCLWDTDTSGLDYSAGGDYVSGRETVEMKTLLTFTGSWWDFTNETGNGTHDYWRMCTDGVMYPKLSWQSQVGDFDCPDGVSTDDFYSFFQQWLLTDCNAYNNYCGGADMNTDERVDLADFAIFAQHWLEGI